MAQKLKNNIKRLRVMRGFTKQKEFRDALDEKGLSVSRVALSLWEKNGAQPIDWKRPVIAKVLRVQVNELFIYE